MMPSLRTRVTGTWTGCRTQRQPSRNAEISGTTQSTLSPHLQTKHNRKHIRCSFRFIYVNLMQLSDWLTCTWYLPPHRQTKLGGLEWNFVPSALAWPRHHLRSANKKQFNILNRSLCEQKSDSKKYKHDWTEFNFVISHFAHYEMQFASFQECLVKNIFILQRSR